MRVREERAYCVLAICSENVYKIKLKKMERVYANNF